MSDRTVSFSELEGESLIEVGAGRPRTVLDRYPSIPILRVADVLDGRIESPSQDCGPDDYGEVIESKISKPGDVVLTAKGTVGRVSLMPPDGPRFAYSPQLCYFRPAASGPLRSRYLYYWFKSVQFWNQADALKGQTDMADYLSLSDVQALKIRIPSVARQDGIIDVLGSLDDKIAVNERIVGTYEQLLRMRFEELRIDEDPEHSPTVAASELVEFNPTIRVPRGDDVVYLDMAAVPTDRATVVEWSRREPKSGTRFNNGDTVMARITPCLENGKTAFIDFMEDGETGIGSTEFIVMRARPGVPLQLPYFLARSHRFRGYAVQNMVGSSGRQRVNAGQLFDFRLRKPDGEKMSEFGTEASKVFAHMRSLANESRDLAELRDALLPKLMSGEIRMRDAEKAVEDVT